MHRADARSIASLVAAALGNPADDAMGMAEMVPSRLFA